MAEETKKKVTKKTEETTETKVSLKDKIMDTKVAKYLKVHGKDLIIGFGIGGGTTAAGYGVYRLVKAKKDNALEYDELPEGNDPYLESIVTSENDSAPVEE